VLDDVKRQETCILSAAASMSHLLWPATIELAISFGKMSALVGRITKVLPCLKFSLIGAAARLRCPLTRTMTSGPPLLPRQFAASGFVKVDPMTKIEEEELPSYVAEKYYPVYIGEIFASRYQVVSKLGYGTSSTAWLCRDLQ
jgi:hypothetical protein